MTDELAAMFAALIEDVDSIPYAHEDAEARLVGDLLKESAR